MTCVRVYIGAAYAELDERKALMDDIKRKFPTLWQLEAEAHTADASAAVWRVRWNEASKPRVKEMIFNKLQLDVGRATRSTAPRVARKTSFRLE